MRARKKFYDGLSKLTDKQLDEEIESFVGKRTRENYLLLFASEILHHEGQIPANLGVEKRTKGNPDLN